MTDATSATLTREALVDQAVRAFPNKPRVAVVQELDEWVRLEARSWAAQGVHNAARGYNKARANALQAVMPLSTDERRRLAALESQFFPRQRLG